MRVRAIRRGYDNIQRREVGDEFDLPDTTNLDPENDWFVVIGNKTRGGNARSAANDARAAANEAKRKSDASPKDAKLAKAATDAATAADAADAAAAEADARAEDDRVRQIQRGDAQ